MEKGQPSVKMPKSRKSFLKISALLTKFQFSVDILFFCPYNEPHRKRRCLIPGAFLRIKISFYVRTVLHKEVHCQSQVPAGNAPFCINMFYRSPIRSDTERFRKNMYV